MAEQQKLVEQLECIAQESERLAIQARRLKSVVQTDFSEDHLFSSEGLSAWKKAVLALSGNVSLVARWVQIGETLTQQIKENNEQYRKLSQETNSSRS